MASDDPDFETKAADVIGLYLAPPQHAAVFCVDEKTAITALIRCFLYLRDGGSGTGLNIDETVPCRCTRRWT
jgi:hypothetical protein